jgi:hypothetical protein
VLEGLLQLPGLLQPPVRLVLGLEQGVHLRLQQVDPLRLLLVLALTPQAGREAGRDEELFKRQGKARPDQPRAAL